MAPGVARHSRPANSGGHPSGLKAVLCDLDDTLYPQSAWLDGAWRAVAAAGVRYGIDEAALLAALRADAALGSARGGIIDRALAAVVAGVAVGGSGHGGAAGSGAGDAGPLLNPAPSQPSDAATATRHASPADTTARRIGPTDSATHPADPTNAAEHFAESPDTAPRLIAPADAAEHLAEPTTPAPIPAPPLVPPPEAAAHLVSVFRAHRPARLEPYPGVREALARLRMAGVRLAVVTDGDVEMQAWKVRALGLSAFFECVVVSDALGGRGVRKPDAVPFLAALEGLGVGASQCVVVGDRPEKDVIGAVGVGIRAIRVKTGEYWQVPDVVGTWHTAADFPAAVEWLLAA